MGRRILAILAAAVIALVGAVLVLLTVVLCFLGYEAIRRVRVLRPLFGLAVAASGERSPSPVPRGAAQAGRMPCRSRKSCAA